MTSRTMPLSRIESGEANTPKNVFAIRDGLKVSRVYAGAIAAKVVNHAIGRNRAVELTIGHPLNANRLSAKPGNGISLSVEWAVPIQAFGPEGLVAVQPI